MAARFNYLEGKAVNTPKGKIYKRLNHMAHKDKRRAKQAVARYIQDQITLSQSA